MCVRYMCTEVGCVWMRGLCVRVCAAVAESLAQVGCPPEPLEVVVEELVHSGARVHVRVGENRRSVARRVAQHSVLWMVST